MGTGMLQENLTEACLAAEKPMFKSSMYKDLLDRSGEKCHHSLPEGAESSSKLAITLFSCSQLGWTLEPARGQNLWVGH